MSCQSKLFAIGAAVCLVLGFFLRGVETVFTVMLTLVGILLIFLSLISRE
jgi:VIT1/CCC1 family predicted Fe2+/Mn2+ transporter